MFFRHRHRDSGDNDDIVRDINDIRDGLINGAIHIALGRDLAILDVRLLNLMLRMDRS